MLTQHYRVPKNRLTLLILVIVILTWLLVLLSNNNYHFTISQQSYLLPWYHQHHDPFTTNSTTFAWTITGSNNNRSMDDMIAYAEQTTRQAMKKDYQGMIPGSSLITVQQVTQFRSQVACWTQQPSTGADNGGKWQYQPTPVSSLLPHFQDTRFGKCDRQWQKRLDHPKDAPRPETQYQWVPPSLCPLLSESIQTDQWCDVIDGRHTLLVGDLVQYQLHDLLLDALREGPTVCYGELNCKDHTVCPLPNTARLRYIRNDLLSKTKRVDLADGKPTTHIIEWPFLGGRPLESFHIVLLNRSPVVEDDMTFVQQLASTMAEIRKIQPDALIIYRSSIIGHPYCDEAQGPFDIDEDDKQHLPFGWSEYQRRNRLAQAVVEHSGGVYLDMAYSMDQRPDGHVGGSDCLRYCMPGPLDSWALLFYNVFLALGAPSPSSL